MSASILKQTYVTQPVSEAKLFSYREQANQIFEEVVKQHEAGLAQIRNYLKISDDSKTPKEFEWAEALNDVQRYQVEFSLLEGEVDLKRLLRAANSARLAVNCDNIIAGLGPLNP
jgi:hypothetical protein